MRLRYIIAAGVTVAVFVVYAIFFILQKIPYGLRSTWPAFVFIFAFSFYLTSSPLREEEDA
jgi:hypothetical protein